MAARRSRTGRPRPTAAVVAALAAVLAALVPSGLAPASDRIAAPPSPWTSHRPGALLSRADFPTRPVASEPVLERETGPDAQSDPPAGPTVTVTGQTFSHSPGSTLHIEVLVRRPTTETAPAAALAVSVSTPIQSVQALERALEDPESVQFREVTTIGLSESPPGRATSIGLAFAVNPSSPQERAVNFPARAVYVVRLSLRSGDESGRTEAETRTLVEFSFSRNQRPLRVALALPVASRPLTGPLAATDTAGMGDRQDVASEVARLAYLARTFARAESLPVVLAVQPSTLSDLVEIARSGDPDADEALSSLSAIAARQAGAHVVRLPYSLLPSAYYSSPGLEREMRSQWSEGPELVSSVLATATSTELALPPIDGFDAQSLERAAELGFESAVIRKTDLSDGEAVPTLQPALGQITGAEAMPVYAAYEEVSPALSSLDFESPSRSPAAVMARLALAARESGGSRGVFLLPPYRWNPDRNGLAALLSMLEEAQWLEPVSASSLFEEVPPALTSRRTRAVLRLRSVQGSVFAPVQVAFSNAAASVEGLASMLGSESDASRTIRRALAAAPSAALPPGNSLGGTDMTGPLAASYDTVNALVRELASQVFLPQAAGITLTAQKSLIPVRIENALPQQIQLSVLLQSDKLVFPEGERIAPVTVPPGGFTLNVPVEAEATGAFSLHISLSSPDGKLVLASQRVQVRYMRVGPLAILLGAAALGTLLYWWIAQEVRRKRPRPQHSS